MAAGAGQGPAPRAVGLPRGHSGAIAATNPWQRAEEPIRTRNRRMDLTRWRQANPLPEPSPFWKLVKF